MPISGSFGSGTSVTPFSLPPGATTGIDDIVAEALNRGEPVTSRTHLTVHIVGQGIDVFLTTVNVENNHLRAISLTAGTKGQEDTHAYAEALGHIARAVNTGLANGVPLATYVKQFSLRNAQPRHHTPLAIILENVFMHLEKNFLEKDAGRQNAFQF